MYDRRLFSHLLEFVEVNVGGYSSGSATEFCSGLGVLIDEAAVLEHEVVVDESALQVGSESVATGVVARECSFGDFKPFAVLVTYPLVSEMDAACLGACGRMEAFKE